ncbi:hypothetical protein BABINDRAFT_99980 [Babjeviella inositovora NRRL Y-12698]|uniref:Uncharacterized protein n=1 Tax=Babjeviella inositovora NRRL Y-12698 TaxID=984486 RepID=A0A1E3QI65_9ASCO|nr:uncharacterized protein BABINDRAFT_99980 [Babjeviella inositovora NRRL Y-12698]ODQ77298.1 hypothetical protein BABINDRAFT_99980 [Babjeviella inositovora NRRL Y-12698]
MTTSPFSLGDDLELLVSLNRHEPFAFKIRSPEFEARMQSVAEDVTLNSTESGGRLECDAAEVEDRIDRIFAEYTQFVEEGNVITAEDVATGKAVAVWKAIVFMVLKQKEGIEASDLKEVNGPKVSLKANTQSRPRSSLPSQAALTTSFLAVESDSERSAYESGAQPYTNDILGSSDDEPRQIPSHGPDQTDFAPIPWDTNEPLPKKYKTPNGKKLKKEKREKREKKEKNDKKEEKKKNKGKKGKSRLVLDKKAVKKIIKKQSRLKKINKKLWKLFELLVGNAQAQLRLERKHSHELSNLFEKVVEQNKLLTGWLSQVQAEAETLLLERVA